jgi:cell division protein FtsZ
LRQGVQGISDIITIPGIINRDFADVKAIMAGMGYAVMGTATARGDAPHAIEAAQKAIASPLLEAGAIDGARGILINITGSSSLKLAEVNEASTIIQSAAHEDANIIFGAVLDEKMKDEVKITVIATGFRTDHAQRKPERVGAAAAALEQARTAQHYSATKNAPAEPAIRQREDRPYETRRSEPEHAAKPAAAQHAAHEDFEEGARLLPSEPEQPRQPAREANLNRSVSAEYSEDDLDVPAFLRKKKTE